MRFRNSEGQRIRDDTGKRINDSICCCDGTCYLPWLDVNFTHGQVGGGCMYNFAANATPSVGAEIVSYVWEFTDGTTKTGQTITHTLFGGDGEVGVTLTVTDSAGCTGTWSEVIWCFGCPCPPACVNMEVSGYTAVGDWLVVQRAQGDQPSSDYWEVGCSMNYRQRIYNGNGPDGYDEFDTTFYVIRHKADAINGSHTLWRSFSCASFSGAIFIPWQTSPGTWSYDWSTGDVIERFGETDPFLLRVSLVAGADPGIASVPGWDTGLYETYGFVGGIYFYSATDESRTSEFGYHHEFYGEQYRGPEECKSSGPYPTLESIYKDLSWWEYWERVANWTSVTINDGRSKYGMPCDYGWQCQTGERVVGGLATSGDLCGSGRGNGVVRLLPGDFGDPDRESAYALMCFNPDETPESCPSISLTESTTCDDNEIPPLPPIPEPPESERLPQECNCPGDASGGFAVSQDLSWRQYFDEEATVPAARLNCDEEDFRFYEVIWRLEVTDWDCDIKPQLENVLINWAGFRVHVLGDSLVVDDEGVGFYTVRFVACQRNLTPCEMPNGPPKLTAKFDNGCTLDRLLEMFEHQPDGECCFCTAVAFATPTSDIFWSRLYACGLPLLPGYCMDYRFATIGFSPGDGDACDGVTAFRMRYSDGGHDHCYIDSYGELYGSTPPGQWTDWISGSSTPITVNWRRGLFREIELQAKFANGCVSDIETVRFSGTSEEEPECDPTV